jgi:hypothetical protein
VLAAIRRAGVSLAYPSRTNYLVRGERLHETPLPADEPVKEAARLIE